MRKLTGLLAVAVITLGAAAPSAAATLTLENGTLSVIIGALPPVVIDQDPAEIVITTTSNGGFDLTSGIFESLVIVPPALFTGVSLISSLNVTATNGAGAFSPTGGIGGGFGGAMPIQGQSVVGVLGGLINLLVPLTVAGEGGNTAVGAAALMITVTGHVWTTGTAGVGGVTSTTPGGFSNTATMQGADNRTTGQAGAILLVTPLFIDTGAAAGVLPGFGVLSLEFAPEPSAALALGSAVLGLAAIGRLRQRRK
jgi:hypothetical protein